MKKFFLTFADVRMQKSLSRIKKQAVDMQTYDEIIVSTENDLDIQFKEIFKEKLNSKIRGFGYWCWKPQIILQTLEKMNYGDILQYTDAGCHLNPQGKIRLEEYFSLCKLSSKGILAFQAKPPLSVLSEGRKLPDLSEYKWCKADTFAHFNVAQKKEITHTQTIGAGVIFIQKRTDSIQLIRSWLKTYYTNFSLIDDSASIIPNQEGFIEHRHDQSVFSILCKINRVDTISAFEYWIPQKNNANPDWHALKNFPIHAKRDKDLGILKNTLCIFRRLAKKFINTL